MTFVDHLKNVRGEDLFAEVAFGWHMVQGDLTKSIVTGASPTHVVKIQHILGEAFGKGWLGPTRGLWFRGTARDSTKYKFYPGIMSPSNADTTQGIDSVFDRDTPHSNLAWIRVECPNGSEVGIPPFDTKNDPPTGLAGIYGCQLGDIYDASGNVTSTGQFLKNPADVIAFGCKEIRRYPNSRIDWASLATLRTACNVMESTATLDLPQGTGLRGWYYDGSAFNTLKSIRIDPVLQYDLSTGAPAQDLTPTAFSVFWLGELRRQYAETYTFYLTHNDSGKLWINDVLIIDEPTAGTHSATYNMTPSVPYLIKVEWTNSSGNSELKLEWQSASQARQVIPQDRLFPEHILEPKFESHIAFTSRTTFEEFLRAVLFTCNGTYQDVDGKLKFFTLENAMPSYTFDETNIVKDTFRFYPRFSQQEMLQLPNRFVADGRDLDSRYLERFDPSLYFDVPDGQATAGRIIEETIRVGNATRRQAYKNLKHYAKLRLAPNVCEFDGLPQTLGVLQGDLVRVTHTLAGWVNKQFLAVEATDKSTDNGPDHKTFKLYSWTDLGW